MDFATRKRLRERLDWLYRAKDGIIRAIGNDMIQDKLLVQPTVDPIKIMAFMQLRSPIHKNTREHLRNYIRSWATIGDCEIPNIHIHDNLIKILVLTKYRFRRAQWESTSSD